MAATFVEIASDRLAAGCGHRKKKLGEAPPAGLFIHKVHQLHRFLVVPHVWPICKDNDHLTAKPDMEKKSRRGSR
jgi:hypothetical protein